MTDLLKFFCLAMLIGVSSCKQTNGQVSFDNVDTSSYQQLPALIPYRDGDVWGFSDRTGKIVVRPQYSETKILSDSLFMGYNTNGDKTSYLYNSRAEILAQYDSDVKYFKLGKEDVPEDSVRQLFLFYKNPSNNKDRERYYIYNALGQFQFDSCGYLMEREDTHRYLCIGKQIGQKQLWGLVDSNGTMIEPIEYRRIYVSYDNYVRVKDSAGALYGSLSNSAYYKWPFTNVDTISEKASSGYFIINDQRAKRKHLFRYDGKIIASIGISDNVTSLFGHSFMVKPYNSASYLIDKNGNLIPCPWYSGYSTLPLYGDSSLISIQTDHSYSYIYNPGLKKLLIDSSDHCYVSEILNQKWVTINSNNNKKVLLNVYTKEKIPLGDEWSLLQSDTAPFAVYNPSTLEVRDLRGDRRIKLRIEMDRQWANGHYVITINSGRKGVFDLSEWKYVLPERYSSIKLNIRSSAHRSDYVSNIIVTENDIHSVYTVAGRKFFETAEDITVSSASRNHVFVEVGDSVILADTFGEKIAILPIARQYAFSVSGYGVAVYGDHCTAVNTTNGVAKNIQGTTELSRDQTNTISIQVPYIISKYNGKTSLINTANFELALPYKYFSNEYNVFYRPSEGYKVTRGLFWAQGREGSSRKMMGLINAKGFQYWKD